VSGGYTIADAVAPGYVDAPATAIYDPKGDSWSTTTSVGGRGVEGVVLADGRVMVAGGQHLTWDGTQHATFSADVEVLDPGLGTWTKLAALRTARAAFTLAQLADGQVVVAAGLIPGPTTAGTASQTADVYDWTTKAWYPAAGLHDAHAEQGSILLPDDTVLVAGGGTATSETYDAGDVTPPATTTPSTHVRSGTTIGTTTVPATVAWTASDSGGSGLGTYDIARSTDGSGYSTLATSLTSTSYNATLTLGHAYRFRVRSRDNAGNLGPWATGVTVAPRITDQTSTSVTYTGTWSTGSTTKYFGGTVRFASSGGASASYTFTGRAVGWVTTRALRSGSARVYIDGVLATTISLYASSYTYRYIAYQRWWTTSGTHTIKIVVVGTSGHPRIDIDAFAVLRDP
jgi:hypothetical protein